MRKSFIRLSLTLLLLFVGVLFFRFIVSTESQDRGVSNVSGSDESNGSVSVPGPLDNIVKNAEIVFPPILALGDAEQPRPLAEMFNFELPLVEGIDQMAASGRWSYDRRVKNLTLWEGLCLASDERISALIAGSGESEVLRADLKRLCADFSEAAVEFDDFFEVEIEERALGVNERAALETSLEDLGPNAATILAISELSRALESHDYAGVFDVVWFLGIYNFDGVSEEFAVYRRQPSVETILAVSAAVFCNSIGGCGRSHPLVLNLCFQFHDLPCYRQPLDVYDAADQILTGYELETFSEMNTALVRLLNRYRRGDL